jgi:hypothetical protein
MQQDHKIASMVSLISSMAEEPISGGSSAATTHAVPTSVFKQSEPLQCPIQQLIAVSDDEESSDDESSDDEASDYDDNSDYSETSSENDGEEHILSAVDFDDLNVDLETSETLDKVEELSELLKEEKEKEEGLMLDAPLLEDTPVEDTTKSIHLDADVTDFTIFKSINISDDHAQPEETSYKKMPLTKLREIAQLNGHSDVSKLKKPELLKLLEAE